MDEAAYIITQQCVIDMPSVAQRIGERIGERIIRPQNAT